MGLLASATLYLGLGAIMLGANTSQVDPGQLLKLAVSRVKENTLALNRLTCEERTSRSYYVASSSKAVKETTEKLSLQSDSGSGLPPLLSVNPAEGRNLLWTDRIRVELSLFNGRDMFSWPGGAEFDSDIDKLVTEGATLSGVLGPLDVSVLMNDADPSLFRYERSVTLSGIAVAEYSYQVPIARSHLAIPDSNGKQITVPYGGFFLIDVATGDLRRLSVSLNQFPKSTKLSLGAVSTDYAVRQIAGANAFVPVSSTMRLLFEEGQLSINNMDYVNCHQFQAESTLSFKPTEESGENLQARSISAQLPPIPRNRTLKLALETPIDSNSAAAGDPIQARVTNSLKSGNGQIVVPSGSVIHGRILRIIHYAAPYNTFQLVLKFDQIQIGDQISSIHLSPPDAETASPAQGTGMVTSSRQGFIHVISGSNQLTSPQDDRKNGTGTFEFPYTDHLHLSHGYSSSWLVN